MLLLTQPFSGAVAEDLTLLRLASHLAASFSLAPLTTPSRTACLHHSLLRQHLSTLRACFYFASSPRFCTTHGRGGRRREEGTGHRAWAACNTFSSTSSALPAFTTTAPPPAAATLPPRTCLGGTGSRRPLPHFSPATSPHTPFTPHTPATVYSRLFLLLSCMSHLAKQQIDADMSSVTWLTFSSLWASRRTPAYVRCQASRVISKTRRCNTASHPAQHGSETATLTKISR